MYLVDPDCNLCEHASSSMKHIHFIIPQMSDLSGHMPYLQTFMGSYPQPLHLYHNVGVEFRCCISDSLDIYNQIGTLIHSLDGFEAFVTHFCSKHHSQLETILGLGGIARNLVPSLVTTIRQHRTCTAEKKQTGNLMIESCETYRFLSLQWMFIRKILGVWCWETSWLDPVSETHHTCIGWRVAHETPMHLITSWCNIIDCQACRFDIKIYWLLHIHPFQEIHVGKYCVFCLAQHHFNISLNKSTLWENTSLR